jgi:hypothetical protein
LRIAALITAFFAVCMYMTYGLNRPLWLDEANTVHIAQGTPTQIADSLLRDVSPPVYYWLLSGWMHLFGTSEIALRIPSILFYLAGIAAMWVLGKMLLGQEGAWLAAFIYAVDPITGRQAQNVRMYSLLALVSAVSMILFLLIQDPKRRTLKWYAAFGTIAFVGLNVHYWFGFVLLAYGCWVLVNWRSWSLRQLLLLFAFTAVPFIAVDLSRLLQQARLPSTAWTERPTLRTLVHAVSGVFHIDAITVACFLALAAAALWGLLARRKAAQAAEPQSWILPAFLYAVSLGVPFLISLKRPIFWPGRYDVIAIPFFAVLVASLLLLMPQRPRALCQLILAATWSIYFARTVHASEKSRMLATLDPAPLGDYDAAKAICSDAKPGDFVIYTALSRAAVDYYLGRLGCSNRVKQVSWPAEIAGHLGWEDPKRPYSQEPALKAEAERTVDEASAARARVFLLFDSDRRLSAGIVSPLEQSFRKESTKKIESCGLCFQELRLYVPK